MGSRILNLQRQARELGRLRTGWSRPNSRPKKRPIPVKSKTWVLTSHAEHYAVAAAKAWGGKVETWQPQGNGAPSSGSSPKPRASTPYCRPATRCPRTTRCGTRVAAPAGATAKPN